MAARNAPVLLDMGKWTLRVGIAGEAHPRFSLPSPLRGDSPHRSFQEWIPILCGPIKDAVSRLGLRVAKRRALLLGWRQLVSLLSLSRSAKQEAKEIGTKKGVRPRAGVRRCVYVRVHARARKAGSCQNFGLD